VTLTLDLRLGDLGSVPLAGEGTLEVGAEERLCSTIRAHLTNATYTAPRLRLEFGEQFAFDGAVTETAALESLLIEGELTWRDGSKLPFTVAQGTRLFVLNDPFDDTEG
jgi:hypothetical protein